MTDFNYDYKYLNLHIILQFNQ